MLGCSVGMGCGLRCFQSALHPPRALPCPTLEVAATTDLSRGAGQGLDLGGTAELPFVLPPRP